MFILVARVSIVSILPDPVMIPCDRWPAAGALSVGPVPAIAGTDNPPHAHPTLGATMGCELAADQSRGKFRPSLEVCGTVYELPPRT